MLENFIFDRASVRTFDANGFLHVSESNISKATVNQYYGKEIPRYRELGLDANTIYNVLRPPEELEKAAKTFDNLPLLLRHEAVSPDQPHKDLRCGTTGTGTVFDGTYLKTSLAIWDKPDIDLIVSDEKKEISPGYSFTPVLENGVFDGQPYSIKMTNIKGNHVAIVYKGRTGSDVVVKDQSPDLPTANPTMETTTMTTPTPLDALKALMATDGATIEQARKLISDAFPEKENDEEEEEEEEIDPTTKKVGDKAPVFDRAVFDAAIATATAKAEEAAAIRVTRLFEARAKVAPLVGDVAMNSAEEVYKDALTKSGIVVNDSMSPAFESMIDMLIKSKASTPAPRIATDSATINAVADKFGLPKL